MIGGLALAGATANITDHPPSPKPQAGESNLGAHWGSTGVAVTGAQELRHEASGAGYDHNAEGPNGQGTDSEAQNQAGTPGQGGVTDATGQPGSASGSHCPAALGHNNAAPAAGPASEGLRGAAGITDSTAAGAAAGYHMVPWSNTDTQAVDSSDKAGYSSSDAAAAIARQNSTGSAASGMGSQGAPAGPSSIVAYRPDAGPGAGVQAGVQAGVDAVEEKQGGARHAGLESDGALHGQSAAAGKSNRSGGQGFDTGRQTDPLGQPIQVRVRFLCRQAFGLVGICFTAILIFACLLFCHSQLLSIVSHLVVHAFVCTWASQ